LHRGDLADLCTCRSDPLSVPFAVSFADPDAAWCVVPHADAITGAHIHAGRDADSNRDPTPWGKRYLHLHGDAHGDVHALCYPHPYEDSDADAHFHSHFDALTHTYPYGDMDAESDAQRHAESDAERYLHATAPAERSMMLAIGNEMGKPVPSSCCGRDM